MKTLCIPFSIAFLFLIASCNKDEPTPTAPATKLDTLTTGWKKILVDTSQTIYDICFINNTTGYFVSDKVYKSTDGGLNWNSISNQPFINLNGTNNGNVFFAGGSNGLYKLTNGAGPLTKVKESVSWDADVFFVDNDNGYYNEGGDLFNSTDGGANWSKVTTTGLGYGFSSTLYFSNKNTGWIVGSNTVYKTDGSPSNWTAASFTGETSSARFRSVFTTPNNTVYSLANNAQLYKSTDGGAMFSSIKDFNSANGWFGDIYFVDNNTGYVSGDNKIYKTTDAGTTWSTVVTLAYPHIFELTFTDAHHGWACGDKGTLLVFND